MDQVLAELERKIELTVKEVMRQKSEIEALKSEKESLAAKVSELEGSVEKKEEEFKVRLTDFSGKIGAVIKQLDSVI